jgi:hypothetical protein
MKIKQVLPAAGFYLAGLINTVSAEVNQNGSEVYVTPNAANGYHQLNQFSLFKYLINFLDLVNYLVYIAAIIVVLYCALLVIISIISGKTDPKYIKHEIEGQEGLKKVVKIIIYMKVILMVIDFVFYIK